MIKWRLPLAGRWFEDLPKSAVDQLYEEELGLWGIFVRGAPAMLSENIQPSKLLANGSTGYLHSLTFHDAEDACGVASANGFQVITLEQPPYAINFHLTLPDGDDGAGIESLTTHEVVVPITVSKTNRSMIQHLCLSQ